MPNEPTPAEPDYTDDVPDFALDDEWVEAGVFGIEFDERIPTSVWHLSHCQYVKLLMCNPSLRIGVEKRYTHVRDAGRHAAEVSFFDGQAVFKVWHDKSGNGQYVRKFAVFRDIVRDGDVALSFYLVIDHASARISCIPVYASLKGGRKIIQQLYFEVRASEKGPIIEKIFKENPEYPAGKIQ